MLGGPQTCSEYFGKEEYLFTRLFTRLKIGIPIFLARN